MEVAKTEPDQSFVLVIKEIGRELPDVITRAAVVAELIAIPRPKARDWLPTFEQLGLFIDKIDRRQENLFRFVIMALST